jgi:lysozyme family protein
MPDTTSADQRFQRSLAVVLKQEGGYVDDPRDPGGATNRGITRKTLASWRKVSPWWQLPKSAVQQIGDAETADIYRGLYWNRLRGAELPAGLDLTIFDYGVNSGPGRAAKALQAELKVATDGIIGPKTLAALKARIAAAGVAGLIIALCDGRLSFLQKLATYAVFGRGWNRRVEDIRKAALGMAGVDHSPTQPRTSEMNLLSGYKTYIVAAAMLIFAIARLVGVDLPAFDGQAPGSLLMEALAIIFLRQGVKSDIRNA